MGSTTSQDDINNDRIYSVKNGINNTEDSYIDLANKKEDIDEMNLYFFKNINGHLSLLFNKADGKFYYKLVNITISDEPDGMKKNGNEYSFYKGHQRIFTYEYYEYIGPPIPIY